MRWRASVWSPDSRRLPADESGWASSGQISRRLDRAGHSSGNGGLLSRRWQSSNHAGFPQLSGRLYFTAVEPFLAHARTALDRAGSRSSGTPFYLPRPISTIAGSPMQRRDFLQMMALAAPALTASDGCSLPPPGSPRFLWSFCGAATIAQT